MREIRLRKGKEIQKRKRTTPFLVIEGDALPRGAIAAAPAEPSQETVATALSERGKMSLRVQLM